MKEGGLADASTIQRLGNFDKHSSAVIKKDQPMNAVFYKTAAFLSDV